MGMAIDVTTEVVVARPRAEVAAFMFDPANDAIWTTGVIECKPLQEGRLVPGAKVERKVKFMGRRFSYLYEVLDADADGFVEMQVNQPFPMRIRYELEDAAGGTVARIRARGDTTGFFKMAAPFVARMAKRSMTNDLETLKEYLEGSSG
jgi:hypothetical protein